MILPLAAVIIAIATWALVPTAWLVAVTIVGVVWCAVQTLHLDAAIREPEQPKARHSGMHLEPSRMPFVSVHVATYDEPPALVIATLESLLALDYPAFEVIVLDNNTPSEETWQPVSDFCARRADVLRFRHVDDLEGAKAGALNLCLGMMRADAALVAVVDADYVVSSHFLKVGVDALQRSNAAFAQFPQAYRGVTPTIDPIAAELEDYFNAFARRANDTRSMLLTGTLSLIKVEPLREVGGWSSATVTEDAELGLRLFAAGYEGLFIDNIAGSGLLPLDYGSLRGQRERWVCGNVQTILRALAMPGRGIARRGLKSVLAQLTAWPALLAVPIIVLLLGALPFPSSAVRDLAVDAAAVGVIVHLLATALRMTVTIGVRGQPLHICVSAMAVKWSLVWCSSVSWIKAITQRSLPFIKTPKSTGRRAASAIHNGVPATLALVALGSHASHGQVLASLACILLAATMPAAAWVDRCLSSYRPEAIPLAKISSQGAAS